MKTSTGDPMYWNDGTWQYRRTYKPIYWDGYQPDYRDGYIIRAKDYNMQREIDQLKAEIRQLKERLKD